MGYDSEKNMIEVIKQAAVRISKSLRWLYQLQYLPAKHKVQQEKTEQPNNVDLGYTKSLI